MFGIFKKIFTKQEPTPKAPATPPVSPRTVKVGGTAVSKTAVAPTPSAPPASSIADNRGAAAAASSSELLMLPVSSVLSSFPEPFRQGMKDSDHVLAIPLEKVLQQLATGSVGFTVGELRNMAPGVFNGGLTLGSEVRIEFPLGEVLKRVNGRHLARRTNQARIEIPAEVTSIFGPKGETTARIAVGEPIRPAQAPAKQPPPPSPTISPKIPATAPQTIQSRAMPSVTPSLPVGGDRLTTPNREAPNATTVAKAQNPAQPTQPAPAAPATLPSFSPMDGSSLAVPMKAVSEQWPAEVQQEIGRLSLTGATLILPLSVLEQALKSGQVQFPWRQLFAWIRPTPAGSVSPSAAELLAELPLKVIAPLFMARHRPTAPAQRVQIAESIPDVFSAAALASATAPPATTATTPPVTTSPPSRVIVQGQQSPGSFPAPAVAHVAVPAQPRIPAQPSKPGIPASVPRSVEMDELLGSKTAPKTVKEIVKNATRLPGVQGAILLSQEGFVISSALPATIKAEAVAAFLPQVFSRASHYSKELKIGNLESLTLHVQGAFWQIFKRGSLYFVVMGRTNEFISLEQITLIATELSRQQH